MKNENAVVATAVLFVLFAAATTEVLVAQGNQGGREEAPAGHRLRYLSEPTDDVGTFGYDWIAASAALSDRGVTPGLNWRLREGLEWQLKKGGLANGLREGEVPIGDEGCAPSHARSRGFYVQEEWDGRFSTALLLSEVAVVATLEAATPGFFSHGNPGVLFALSDVVPLHARSVPVDYLLVPFDRLVIQNRIFCAVTPSDARWRGRSHPEVGDRVVVLGERGLQGVVRVGAWWDRLGYLAVVDESQTLHWDDVMQRAGRPTSLLALRSRVEEAVSGGLFDVTKHLVSQKYGSPDRIQFAETLRQYETDSCRVASVHPTDGGGWAPKRLVCLRTKAEEQ